MNTVTATTAMDPRPPFGLILLPDAPRYSVVACTTSCTLLNPRLEGLLRGRGLFDVEWPADFGWMQARTNISRLSLSLQRAVASGEQDNVVLDARHETPCPQALAGPLQRKWSATQLPFDDGAGKVQYIVHLIEPMKTSADAEKIDDTAMHEPFGEVARMRSMVHELQQRTNQMYGMQADFKRTVEKMRTFMSNRSVLLQQMVGEQAAMDERERRALARDLHDDLAQTLMAARMKLFTLGKGFRGKNRELLSEVEGLIADADRFTRSLASQLMPPMLYELGLVPALQWLCEEMERRYGLHVEFVDDALEKPLSQDTRSIVYRAVRELLINVAKHAKVDTALLVSCVQGRRIVIRVSDDGVGFDFQSIRAESVAGSRYNLGLASIPERVAFLGGRFDIESRPGQGTTVTLTVPLQY
ncbi:sensor histidine kinase [Azohydromonas aeria]|uniref:sensor histidine kinase n=1 Tax=Azohydromonas aeria TaxID=2590212 RepID=UPI0012F842F3|nr:sensor histidine kinase [Azohydromonas aeria]